MEQAVQLFLVERVAPGITQHELHAIHSRLINASWRLSECGIPVDLLRCTSLPTCPGPQEGFVAPFLRAFREQCEVNERLCGDLHRHGRAGT